MSIIRPDRLGTKPVIDIDERRLRLLHRRGDHHRFREYLVFDSIGQIMFNLTSQY